MYYLIKQKLCSMESVSLEIKLSLVFVSLKAEYCFYLLKNNIKDVYHLKVDIHL
jgi:hypothetical protein